MQFRVSIPDHVKAGQTIRIRCPDGSEGDVKVPKGLKGGDSFIFEMPKAQLTKGATKSSFLDREIANLHDFLTALVVGVGIGLSIVTGFIVGVLVVTDPQA
jgi:hypothetical protein